MQTFLCVCACVCVCLCLSGLVGSFRAFVCVLRFLHAPDLFGLASVVQKEEDICILTDAVVSKALQIDEEVVRHRDTATVTMALSRAVTLGMKTKVTANKTGPHCKPGQLPATLYICLFSRSVGVYCEW